MIVRSSVILLLPLTTWAGTLTRSSIYMLVVSILPLFGFETVPTVWYFLFIILLHSHWTPCCFHELESITV